MKKIGILLLILLPGLVISDQIYRWTDENGVVHFSHKPTREATDHEKIDKPDISHSEQASQEATTDKKETVPEPVLEADNMTPERMAYCDKLRQNLNTMKSSPRIRIKREDGEFEILNDKARQAEQDRLKKLLKESC